MTDVQSASAGHSQGLILKIDGTLWTCGANQYGQLGDNTTISRLTYVQVTTGVQNVDAGHLYTLIVKTDGTLWACGLNQSGQLGDGTTVDKSARVQIKF